jgi:hypothetical protein
MSTTEDRSSDASGTANVGSVDTKLEVIVIPVSDVGHADGRADGKPAGVSGTVRNYCSQEPSATR